MLILRAPTYSPTDKSDEMLFNPSGSVKLLKTKTNNSADTQQYKFNISNGTKDVEAKILTIFQGTVAKLHLRLINCAVIITGFMVVIIEQNPDDDAIVEFIIPGYLNYNTLASYNDTVNAPEIKIKHVDPSKTDLTDSIVFYVGNSTTSLANVADPTNKFIKIFNKSTNAKMNYVLNLNLDNDTTPTKFFKLEKTQNTFLTGSTIELKFSQIFDIFDQAIDNGAFDSNPLVNELSNINNKNTKLKTAIDEAKKYLENSKKNLENKLNW